jgi:hypothetical protein
MDGRGLRMTCGSRRAGVPKTSASFVRHTSWLRWPSARHSGRNLGDLGVIEREFGTRARMISDTVTRREGEEYENYVERIADRSGATLLKTLLRARRKGLCLGH